MKNKSPKDVIIMYCNSCKEFREFHYFREKPMLIEKFCHAFLGVFTLGLWFIYWAIGRKLAHFTSDHMAGAECSVCGFRQVPTRSDKEAYRAYIHRHNHLNNSQKTEI